MTHNSMIVDELYRVVKVIGEGGGGKVYLAEHLRLHKDVVLKFIKNSHRLSDRSLRREVDALKNLHHSYIPHVYDFVSKPEMTYTVMDYIDGESLDRYLDRKEVFEQARILKWLRQLLEAVDYLHNVPPNGILHADIKPANIMINQNDDVQLVDFNIALALGDDGAVAVGRSLGYASPEHYGFDYRTPTVSYSEQNIEASKPVSFTETVLESTDVQKEKKKILLDKRSDIYSIGATMYHLLYGKRPETDASKNFNLTAALTYSPNLIDIIKKAMNPNPDMRYQSAEAMLYDVNHIKERDPRLIRLRHSFYASIFCSGFILFLGIGMVSVGLKQSENLKNAYYMAEKSASLLEKGDVSSAIESALSVLLKKHDIFNPKSVSPAIKALTDATGVYDVTEGFRKYALVDVKSQSISAVMTEDGRYSAIKVSSYILILDNAEKEIVERLEADSSAFSDVSFIDNEHILYAASDGLCLYDIKNHQAVWNKKAGNRFGLSNNKDFIVSVLNDERKAYIYKVKDGNLIKELKLETGLWLPNNHQFLNSGGIILSINDTADKLAFSLADGTVLIKDRDDKKRDIEILPKGSGYSYFTGGFYREFFAFSAAKEEDSIFSVIDCNKMEATGGFKSELMFLVKTDKAGIYLSNDNVLVQIDPITGKQKALADLSEHIDDFAKSDNYVFVNSDKAYYIFDSEARQINRYKKSKNKKDEIMALSNTYALLAGTDHPYIQLFSKEKNKTYIPKEEFIYNRDYKHDEVRINSDEKSIILYDYSTIRIIDGKEGKLIHETKIENAQYVLDQQYERMKGGDKLKVIYNDGKVIFYDAKDASVTYGEDETVDKEITDVFETDRYIFKAPLHGAVQVYDRKSGKFIKELSNEDYLTYVTELEDYIIAEYITGDSERYGILMNKKLEALASLPKLTDILNGRLYFDDRYGKIKSVPIYSLDEIKQRAFEILEKR